MNKHFIVLLAVCLVSVHAFVKREAETAPSGGLPTIEDLQKKIEDLSKQVADALKPEAVKQSFNDAVDAISKTIDDLKAKPEAPKQ